MVRFSAWDQILADRGLRHDAAFTRGVWRYARAMALTAMDRLDEAEHELGEIKALVAAPSIKGQTTFSSRAGGGSGRDCGEAEGLFDI